MTAMLEFFSEAEFCVAVSFVLFLAILWRFGVYRTALAALDARGDRIRSELDEARNIRDEAQALLTRSELRRREAEREAEAIIASAKAEAEQLAAEAKAKIEEFIARRTKIAEAKIGQAEIQAVADVRAAAADAAVAAAGKILTDTAKGSIAEDLIARGIADLRAKLN
jgi:F-type H+-transporting ATPase subunit b